MNKSNWSLLNNSEGRIPRHISSEYENLVKNHIKRKAIDTEFYQQKTVNYKIYIKNKEIQVDSK